MPYGHNSFISSATKCSILFKLLRHPLNFYSIPALDMLMDISDAGGFSV